MGLRQMQLPFQLLQALSGTDGALLVEILHAPQNHPILEWVLVLTGEELFVSSESVCARQFQRIHREWAGGLLVIGASRL